MNYNYAGMIKNDVAAGQGVCVTLFTQGCPIHCPGCHNSETWDPKGGKLFDDSIMRELLDALKANGVQRNFCLMGGEPLCEWNLKLSVEVCETVRKTYPDILIYIWTGYTMEQLDAREGEDKDDIYYLLSISDYLIAGPYIQAQRDITLPMRGSRNQKVYTLREKGETAMEFASLEALKEYESKMHTFKEGEEIKVADKFYIYKDGEFIEKEKSGVQMSLYEINKQLVSNLPNHSEDDLYEDGRIINSFYQKHKGQYYMLLGKDLSYYTVFEKGYGQNNFSNEVIDCLRVFDGVVSVEHTDNGVEIWVRQGEDVFCLYLFPYDDGIVIFGE